MGWGWYGAVCRACGCRNAHLHRGSVSIIVYDTKQAVYEGIYFVHPAVLGDLGAFTSPRESSLACTCLQTTADMQYWVCYGVHAGAHLAVIVSVLSRYHLRSTLRLQVSDPEKKNLLRNFLTVS